MPTIRFNKINENARIPTKKDEQDLCFDIYALESVKIYPGQTVVVSTGIRAVLPDGYGCEFKERSGMASKGVVVGGGEIDCGYRGEWGVILRYNAPKGAFDSGGFAVADGVPEFQGEPYCVEAGDKIAQARLVEMIPTRLEEIDDAVFNKMANTNRGDKGFGSSGA